MNRRLSRRTLLRGAGVAVALPSLEIMMHSTATKAAPTTPPKRFCISWIGNALAPNGSRSNEKVTPATTGTGWAVPRSLSALTEFNLANQVSVVSNLYIPWSMNPGPAQKGLLVHFNTMAPQFSGTRGGGGAQGTSISTTPTADQIVADIIAPGMLTPTLAYRMQATAYIGGDGGNGRQSYRRAANGSLTGIDPFSSPRLAYNSLFSGANLPNANADEVRRAAFLLKQRKSVLDLVGGDLDRLKTQVGAADKQRLERHAEEIRALEARISRVEMPMGSTCVKPPDPGADPALSVGGAYAYSGEAERSAVFTDLIAMAFACDKARVASYMLTHMKCWMGLPPSYQRSNVPDIHQMSHEGPPINYADALGYLVRQWALMLKKIRDVRELDGSSVLDHTAAVLVFEAGHGADSETGGNDSPHSTENMCILIGGGAGGLKRGTHVRVNQQHPATAVITAMKAVGYAGTSLGEVNGFVPQLLP